jgi:hypothetical protein
MLLRPTRRVPFNQETTNELIHLTPYTQTKSAVCSSEHLVCIFETLAPLHITPVQFSQTHPSSNGCKNRYAEILSLKAASKTELLTIKAIVLERPNSEFRHGEGTFLDPPQ